MPPRGRTRRSAQPQFRLGAKYWGTLRHHEAIPDRYLKTLGMSR